VCNAAPEAIELRDNERVHLAPNGTRERLERRPLRLRAAHAFVDVLERLPAHAPGVLTERYQLRLRVLVSG
jgi:hypothetical protein